METVVAAVLHDVVDDTGHTLADVEEAFGGEVARLVDGVSRLSYINQLLRRHRRTTAEQQERENTGLSPEDVRGPGLASHTMAKAAASVTQRSDSTKPHGGCFSYPTK